MQFNADKLIPQPTMLIKFTHWVSNS